VGSTILLMIHPARSMDFADLYLGLASGVVEGTINKTDGPDGLQLFTYSQECVYGKKWDTFSLMARGLIVHRESQQVVATPFPKFFNVGEREGSLPNLPFETFEKLDGSLIILFHFNGQWRAATKGSFVSEQAEWAAKWIRNHDLSPLDTEATYLCEAIYPENRIVVSYDYSGLTLLAGYRGDGMELSFDAISSLGTAMGWRVAKRHSFNAVSELLSLAKTLPASQEGFVLRFDDGLRVKVKGDEYCRIHRLVSRVTPLAVWELLSAGDDPEEMRKQLPEEFWGDFDAIHGILIGQAERLAKSIAAEADAVAGLPDRDVGMRLDSFTEPVRRFIFPYRKNGGSLFTGKPRTMLFREVRPTGNRLEGYRPSSAVTRVLDEAA